MREWNDPFNPFNSMKILLWKNHLEACAKGEYLPPVTVDTDPSNRCNFDCIWCLPPDTLVLTKDFEYKKIKKLKVGDSIVGFDDQNTIKHKHKKLISSKIKCIVKRKETSLITIKTENGHIEASPFHRIWDSRGRWKYAKNFKKNDYIKSVSYNPEFKKTSEFKRGWLAGISDGDGCFWTISKSKRRQYRLSTIDKEILDSFKKISLEFNYKLYEGNNISERFGIKYIPSLFLTKSDYAENFEEFIHNSDMVHDYIRGWLGGIFDSDGSFSKNILRICQCKKHIKDKIIKYLKILKYNFNIEKNGIYIKGGIDSHIRFFNECKPLLSRKKNNLFSNSFRSKSKVLDVIEKKYDGYVYDIETESHNFIANGMKVHNCNAFDMMHGNNKMTDIPEDHLIKLADFYKRWGVQSSCVAGGGEPLMNEGTMAFLERMYTHGLENGLITNGVLLNDEKIDIVAKTCRWVGISMDAATSETFIKVKGIKNEGIFYRVVKNLKKLTKRIDQLGIKNDVCYKFLLHPYNAHEILDAVKLAKVCGVRDFQLRPVGWINLTKTKDKKLDFEGMYEMIDNQIGEALKLETNDFHVYGIRHKFNPDLKPKKNFSKCWTIPMLPTFGADGNVHTCFDMRGRKDLIMCKHYPDPEEILNFWNSEVHKEMINNIDINKCPRCTWTTYNEAVEKVIIDDKMCHKFP